VDVRELISDAEEGAEETFVLPEGSVLLFRLFYLMKIADEHNEHLFFINQADLAALKFDKTRHIHMGS